MNSCEVVTAASTDGSTVKPISVETARKPHISRQARDAAAVPSEDVLDLLRGTSIFRPISNDGIDRLAEQMQPRRFSDGEVLMRQGERSDVMYIITEGQVRVERREVGEAAASLAELGPGDVVGEMGILDKEPRSATVTAIGAVTTLELGAVALTEVMVRHPEVAEALWQIVTQRLHDTDAVVARMFADLMRKVDVFGDISADGIALLAQHGQWRQFAPGEVLMRQGAPSDCLHVIARGRVLVYCQHPALTEAVQLGELGPGEVVGEMGLPHNAPRSATVVALNQVDTMELSADALAEAMARHPDIAMALLHVVTRRIRRTDELIEHLTRREALPARRPGRTARKQP